MYLRGGKCGHEAVCVKFKEHLGVLGAGSNIIHMAEFLAHFSSGFACSFFSYSSREQGDGPGIKSAKASSWEIFFLICLDHNLPNRPWWGHGSQFFIFFICSSPSMSKMEI